MVSKIIEEKDRRAAAVGESWDEPNEDCPDTWVEGF
jgi:hypothetical protein